jgi:hypothetical protein
MYVSAGSKFNYMGHPSDSSELSILNAYLLRFGNILTDPLIMYIKTPLNMNQHTYLLPERSEKHFGPDRFRQRKN